jgi:predicted RecB family nuclease
MKINEEILHAFTYCDYKAHQKSLLQSGNISDYQILYNELKQNKVSELKKNLLEDKMLLCSDFTFDNTVNKKGFSLNLKFTNENIDLMVDGIEFINAKSVVPILIIPFEKITIQDKLYITLQSFLLQNEFNIPISNCKVFFGKEIKQKKMKLQLNSKTIKKKINDLNKILVSLASPIFFKNTHCSVCEFQITCHEKLVERDDLSLLTALKSTEIIKKNNRGIFSVKQLSYLFRPKKNAHSKRKFTPELKALAIREKSTFIIELPNIKFAEVIVFLDFEGINDRNSIYLIGLVIKKAETEIEYSFWAENENDEIKIFTELFSILKSFNNFVIYHYGSYEIQAIKRISKKLPTEYQEFTKIVIDNSVNILNVFANNIYPPTYSNSLKEIAQFLKFNWTEKKASGIQSTIWRYRWELTPSVNENKLKLIQYNIEDCRALMTVVQWIKNIPDNENEIIKKANSVKVENIKKWCKTDYQLDNFERINKVSYFNYQRNKIYLRTNENLKKIVKRVEKNNRHKIVVDKQINVFYNECPFCKGNSFEVKSDNKGIVVDLEFIKNGIKRCVKELNGGIQICNSCNQKLMPINFKDLSGYGNNLVSWSIDQYISYRIGLNKVAHILKETFNINIGNCIYEFKEKLAKKYNETYLEIKRNLISGTLIHVDETDVNVRKFTTPYIWVFANFDTVLYHFTTNREADFLPDFLKEFKGILISDFYTGYDSMSCSQQKCLIHLIRDLNNDLLKNQFNTEFSIFVQKFSKLLRDIIETIDKFGLSLKHFAKHKLQVEIFFDEINNIDYQTDLCIKYLKRFNKNKIVLFTFLDHDNIPWNNNNAEHAIKAFAKYRRDNDGLFTERSIKDYIILLSIQQTCVYRGISFLDFLKSEEISIERYTANLNKK